MQTHSEAKKHPTICHSNELNELSYEVQCFRKRIAPCAEGHWSRDAEEVFAADIARPPLYRA